MKNTTVEINISKIKIDNRHRKEMGDIEGLAQSVEELGLLQPIGITPDNRLIFGERRLRAYRDVLGRQTVPARIIEVKSVLLGQIAEDTMRKNYTVSERLAIVDALRSFGHGGDRRSKEAREDEKLTVDEAAKKVGFSKDGYFRAKKVAENGVAELVDAMDQERLSVSTAATLAEAAPEEQTECLTKGLDEERLTARGIQRALRRIRIDQTENGQSDLSKAGSRTRRGNVEIWCGDCLALMEQRIEPDSVDVVVTSPPYNIGVPYSAYNDDRPKSEYLDWLAKVFQSIKRVLKEDGSFFLNVGSTRKKPWLSKQVAEVAGRYFTLQNEIVWIKSMTLDGRSHGHFTPVGGSRFLNRNWESIFHFTKTGEVKLDRLAVGVPYQDVNNLYRNNANGNLRCGGDVWFLPHKTTQSRRDKSCHPCVFPVELPERCIRLHGIKKNMIVLDPFCGTGSSMVAAARLGAKGVGIDLDPAYCRAAERRLKVGETTAFPKQNRLTSKAKSIRPNSIVQGDCRDLIPCLPDGSINFVPTSPPYAEQRSKHYPSIPEAEYPQFTVEWMAALWDKLADDGSVMIVIDPHVKNGVQSDYVLRTQTALRDFGWKQHRTQKWLKRDRGPLGHKFWPRHCYEEMFWFSKSSKPFCNPKNGGKQTEHLTMNNYHQSNWTNGGKPGKKGIARVRDVWDVPVGGNENGVDHPARFPVKLPQKLIPTFCPKGGTVLDPFAGSGSSLVAAKNLSRTYYGFDLVADYCKIARKRLSAVGRPSAERNAG